MTQTTDNFKQTAEERTINERWIVIVNPKAGSAGEDVRTILEQALNERAAEFEVRETTKEISGGQLAQEAIAEGATNLMACGGDGTVMAVVNGIGKSELQRAEDETSDEDKAKPRVTLAIIPLGTANLLAGALHIPIETDAAIAAALTGVDRIIDLGRCSEHLFALGMGLGLTERLVSQTSAREKERLGKLAYAKAMLRDLGARPHTFTLKLDKKPPKRRRGVAIVIANSGEMGGGLHFAPNAKMDDGYLDVCILHRFYFRDVVRMAWNTLRGQLPKDRAVSFYKAKRIEILSDPPLDLQIDGEVVDQKTPLVTEVVPQSLRVRVPTENEASDEKSAK